MDRYRRVLLVAVVGALLAAFALRLQQLGAESLWYDETVSAYLAGQSLPALVAHTARDIHPPLYYVLLHVWVGLVGTSEYALAFFSLWWGVLLVASTVTLARWLGTNTVALLVAGMMTLSPFNIWYSQEVRMYTMGATLGVWSLLALWGLLRGHRMKKRWMTLWVLSAAAGLYTLYYFALLLFWEALFVAWWLWGEKAPRWRWRRWAVLGGAVLLLWSPWLPVAFRQATNPPVPPWRTATPAGSILLESLSALALGQSMNPRAIWYWIALLVLFAAAGLWLNWRQRPGPHLALLLGALGVPLGILLLTTFTPSPLYHVRYLFTYSPPFYLLLAMAFMGWVRLAQRFAGIVGAVGAAGLLLTPLLVLSGESLQRFWNDPQYAADDLRGGVQQVEEQWTGSDALLLNAGYTYTALDHYFRDPVAWQGRLNGWNGTLAPDGLTALRSGSIGGSPSLGWGLPESDFYAISAEETLASLERISETAARLWHFRLYDTVTDPDGLIRDWLDENALLFNDTQLTGESNARVQGWYFPPEPGSLPQRPIAARFLSPDGTAPWLTLHGVDAPTGRIYGGGWVDVTLWLEGSEAMDPETRLSIGLFDTSIVKRQWAVEDVRPLEPMLSLKDVSGVQRWPVRVRLPQGVPPGRYDLLVKFYRPSDGAVLVAEGERVQNNRQQVQLVVVEVAPTPPLDTPPQVGTPQEARFGPLQFLGHAIPPGPWQPGAVIPIELVWRLVEPADPNLRMFLASDALQSDDGGIYNEYPPSLWRVGEVVRDIHYVTVAPGAAPGDYPLYLRVSQNATTVPWSQGLFGRGEILQVGTLTIEDRPRLFEPPQIATPLEVTFGESIQLVGATLPTGPYQPGQEVPITLNWYAAARPPGRYKIFTHLIGPDLNLGPQRDLEPGEGTLPTNGWARGEYVTTAYTIVLPPETQPGRFELRVGLYDPLTNERIPPFGSSTNSEQRYVTLGSVEVAAP